MGKPIIWKKQKQENNVFQIYLIKIIAFLSGPLKKNIQEIGHFFLFFFFNN